MLPPLYAPVISAYAADAALLVVMFLGTSSHFELPLKKIAAGAIITVPSAFELIGGLANAQCTLPIGGFMLLFCRPSRFWFPLIVEAPFIAVMALDGHSKFICRCSISAEL